MNTQNGNVCNYIESVRSLAGVEANIHLHRLHETILCCFFCAIMNI